VAEDGALGSRDNRQVKIVGIRPSAFPNARGKHGWDVSERYARIGERALPPYEAIRPVQREELAGLPEQLGKNQRMPLLLDTALVA
jgi:hypothetical protein